MDASEHADLMSRLFAVLTGRLEDAAEIAAGGLGRTGTESAYSRASQLITIGREVATVSEAVAALCSVEKAAG